MVAAQSVPQPCLSCPELAGRTVLRCAVPRLAFLYRLSPEPSAEARWRVRNRLEKGIEVRLVLIALAISLSAPSLAHHSEQHNYLLSWIPAQCCVTNNCCFEIHYEDIEPLADGMWRIRASGQVVRAQWSKDGHYYRCACDPIGGTWVVSPGAHTRCLFVPMPSS